MRTLSCLLLVVLLGVVAGCNRNPPAPSGPEKPVAPGGGQAPGGGAPDDGTPFGGDLYPKAPAPEYPVAALTGSEPIIIPNMTVQYEDRQQVSAEVDGKIELIASPMRWNEAEKKYEFTASDGTRITHDPLAFAKNMHTNIVFNPREKLAHPKNPEKWVPYWRLREGDQVVADQILCVLDDQVVKTKMDSAGKIKEAAKMGLAAAEDGVAKTKKKMELTEMAGKGGLVAPLELLNDAITLTRFIENMAQSLQAIAKAEADHAEAEIMLGRHRVKSQVTGFVRSVVKRPGEFVRAGEKIFEIQSTEKVRLEGNLDVQYVGPVKAHMSVKVEPAVPSAPRKGHAWHRQAVTGVAVTGHPLCPLVVSTGADGTALVWDPNLKGETNRSAVPQNLPHPVAVRCVAASPPGSPVSLILTGADDGKVRVWKVVVTGEEGKPETVTWETAPHQEPADAHAAAVTAAAVSPDGKFAATAAGREVFVWDLTTGKKRYALPAEHRDTVTSLSFTPQAQLVTASRDRTLKVWDLGANRGVVARTIDHRSGVVDILGVSPDGGRVLFDQDKSRIDLVNLTDSRTSGQLTNVGPSVAFATLAVFGPEFSGPETPAKDLPPYLIVTAGGDGDLKGGLQVWHAPRAGGRGAEIARLITPGRVAVTCAAFSPHKEKENRFLVVGTAAGTVHLWTQPTGPATKMEGRITHIDFIDPRYATVRVEMDNNKDFPLRDRSAATVIVQPAATPAKKKED